MQALASRGGASDRARFRRLTGATIVGTFLLVLIGGVVRLSDSGLGCGPAGAGTEGWPLCNGGLVPVGDSASVIEFTHRVSAAVVGVMVLALAWMAFRRLRDDRPLVRGSGAALVLVVAQALLGGLTVEEGLHEALVAAHLGLAMLLLGLLVLMYRFSAPTGAAGAASGADGAAPNAPTGLGALRAVSVTAATLVLATIVAGGLVAGTEGEGRANEPVAGAHMACGEEFPTCGGELLPFGSSRLVDIHLVHRVFMYMAVIAVIAMVALAVRRRAPSRAFAASGALLVAQVALGASNVWFGEHAGLILAHLALGTVLWWSVVLAGASLLPATRRADARAEPESPETQPAPA